MSPELPRTPVERHRWPPLFKHEGRLTHKWTIEVINNVIIFNYDQTGKATQKATEVIYYKGTDRTSHEEAVRIAQGYIDSHLLEGFYYDVDYNI
jgi:hypothetical protein